MASPTLVGRIREVTGLKGYLQYGRGQTWIVLKRGTGKDYTAGINQLKAEFETWKMCRTYKWGKSISYHFLIRSKTGKLLGFAYCTPGNHRGEQNILIDYVNMTDLNIENWHRDNRTYDKRYLTYYKQLSKGRVWLYRSNYQPKVT